MTIVGPISRSLPILACLLSGMASLHAQRTDRISVNAFLSGSYSYNFNRPAGRLNDLRVFDFDDGDFKLDVAELALQLPAERPNDAGFRMDVTLGGSIPRVTASRGLFRNADGSGEDIDLQQAFISYIARIGTGLRFDLGKFVTPVGFETIEGCNGYNDNATRSFLFGYAIPFTHTGLRLSYAPSDKLSASAMIVNGWDVVRDNNGRKTVGAQITLAPARGMALGFGYIGGAEQDNNDSDLRHLFDMTALWKPTDSFMIGINGDYGAETDGVVTGKVSVWEGIAGYVKVGIWRKFWLALRAEAFQDRDGARTGTPQTLSELTLTPEYHPIDGIGLRADLRLDFSSATIFTTSDGFSSRQPTVLVNVFYLF